ncbi:hypothetical protein EPUL_004044 [Erysiphe pulchra]|uniref:Uncharacterized protein n=1 Tax=Erysiphe pulchra TaxID=225359 RepID=A0A2S4PRZ7_9PEZI|nr:hypothetical protein EPUL_004044 [Erysiphe pulchra]
MDISQESQAPSTERSQPPPSPQYPIFNSPFPFPFPFASPSPPLNLELPSKTTDGRQILKPVAPSKRPVFERPTQIELAEILSIRQRRERARHARLMICTTAISSIDSNLACFKDEIEKEEAVAFKAYLQLAIANFAAVDTSPTYQKSHHTLDRQEALQAVENTWAKVARCKSKKKARVTLNTKAKVALVRKEANTVNNKDKLTTRASPNTATTDRRLFWRKLSPAGIREIIVRKLSILPALLGKIKAIHSGFALSPCNTEARETILNAGNGLFLSGAKLEAATNWIPVIVPTMPPTIRKEQGEVVVSKSMLIDEIERVCSIRPAHVTLYGGNKAEAPHRTWMQQPLESCKRCNGHHPTKSCSRAPSCGNCGSTNNTEDICIAATKCRYCGGPHRSDSRRCLARLTRSGVPTKKQMKTYRQAGEREYQAVLRAKATEESAACTEHNNIDLTNSQVPEVDDNFDKIPASPVDVSTGDAMRL